VAGAAFFEAGADGFGMDGEAGVAEALFEFAVFAGGPDGEDAGGFKGGEGGGDAGVVIEGGVFRGGKGGGAVVHVEEDGVELGGAGAEFDGDVEDFDAGAFVFQRVIGERAEGAAVPFDDGGEEFGDDDFGAGREKIESGAEGEAHAEAADEDAGLFAGAQAGAGESGEGFLGAVHAAGH